MPSNSSKKSKKISKMQDSLIEVGILPEAANVAVQQYTALLNVDPMLAGNYAREVQDNVTGAYYRIMLMYKDKMGDDFDEEQDFMEEYVSSLVQRNMDYLIRSFQQSFAGDISNVEEHVSYDGWNELSTADYVGDYIERKHPTNKTYKQVEYDKPTQVKPTQTKSVEPKPISQKKAKGWLGNRIKFAARKAVSAIKSLFRRGR